MENSYSYDLVTRTKTGSLSLSSKFIGDDLGPSDKVWIVRYNGQAILMLPFDGRVGVEDMIRDFASNLALAVGLNVAEDLPDAAANDSEAAQED